MQSAFFGHSKQKDYIYFVQLCQQQNTVWCWVVLCANCKLFERPDKRFEYIAAFLKIPEEIKAGACRRKQNRIAWDRILIRTFYRIRVIFKMVNFYHILLRRVRSTNGRFYFIRRRTYKDQCFDLTADCRAKRVIWNIFIFSPAIKTTFSRNTESVWIVRFGLLSMELL